MKEVLAWGVVYKRGEDFWCSLDEHYWGRMSIYDTRKNALKSKGKMDKVIRVKIVTATRAEREL